MGKSRHPSRYFPIALIVGFVILSSSAGFSVRHAQNGRRIDAAKQFAARQRVYEQTETEFDHAEFWKPRDSAGGAIAAMAPLIVQQVIDDSNSDRACPRFGALVATAFGRARVDTRRATVYFRACAAELGGAIREQIEYIWFYASPSVSNEPDATEFLILRVTLGKDGFPLVWEVDDSAWRGNTDPRILFVADSLEVLAMDTFGQPLPDRRFVIERSVANAPRTVVANVFEDGPIPMGPYVYLSAKPRRVTTLLCRCSPSQVHAFDENGYYDLRPLGDIEGSLERLTSGLARRLIAGDRKTKGDERLDKALRWPDGRSGD